VKREQRAGHQDTFIRGPVAAPGDRARQLAGPCEVDRNRRRGDAEHLPDHPPAVVVVLGLLLIDPDSELSQRVDDDPRERHERPDEVLLTDRDPVRLHVPATAGRDEVADRRVQ
jgi:hypothetical protein